MHQSTFWYLASPYAAKHARHRRLREDAVILALGLLMKEGIKVFAPIAHSARAAARVKNTWEHQDYLDYDTGFLQASCGVMVLQLPGWEASKGVDFEINWAYDNKKPVSYLGVEHWFPHQILQDLRKAWINEKNL